MNDTEVKEKILILFQNDRQRPNTFFDESHFLDFLTYPPHKKNSIKNSFKGVRKYYRFMDKLELEFEICFSLPDLDKYYSVDSLTTKIQERIQKRNGNIKILKRRNEEKESYLIEIILTSIIVATYVCLGFHWLSLVLTVIFGIVICWILGSKIHNRQHNQKLSLKLLKKEK